MISSKDRSHLRSLANEMQTIFQVGKGGLTENVIRQYDEALTARGLVKSSVQKNAEETPSKFCSMIADATNADIVQVIGRKFVLYRHTEDHKSIYDDPRLDGRAFEARSKKL